MSILNELDGLVSAKFGLIKTVFSLIKLETRLAALSVLPFLLSLCFLLIVLMGLWFLAMIMLGYALFIFFNKFILAISLIFILNLLVCLGLIKYLAFNLQSLSFEKTRKLLSRQEDD